MSVLRAEWTKVSTAGGVGWFMVAAVVAIVAVGAGVSALVECSAEGCTGDPARLSLTGVGLGQAIVAIAAVMVIGNEYGTGMIHTTLAAIPRRLTVLAAKAALITVLVLPAAILGVLASVQAGRLMLPGNAEGLSFGDGAVLRAIVGSVVYLVLIALLSLGVAAAVRDPATAVGAVLALLYLFPIMAQIVPDQDWQKRLEQIGPMNAGLAVQATTDLQGMPIGPWAGLGVLTAWAAAALLLGSLVLRCRDA
ncbi:ABC transporter permease [Spirillospora sp. CA-294931]|uniref:ABC transporter permease n=1 Tax=Spirillospora sp. CA-294931 TaxID=3240042 RepID=UPI003D8B3BC2